MTEMIKGRLLAADDFPVERFTNADPGCPPDRRSLVQTFAWTLVPKKKKTDPSVWRKELLWSFYASTGDGALNKARAFIAAELERHTKSEASKQARRAGLYRKMAKEA